MLAPRPLVGGVIQARAQRRVPTLEAAAERAIQRPGRALGHGGGDLRAAFPEQAQHGLEAFGLQVGVHLVVRDLGAGASPRGRGLRIDIRIGIAELRQHFHREDVPIARPRQRLHGPGHFLAQRATHGARAWRPWQQVGQRAQPAHVDPQIMDEIRAGVRHGGPALAQPMRAAPDFAEPGGGDGFQPRVQGWRRLRPGSAIAWARGLGSGKASDRAVGRTPGRSPGGAGILPGTAVGRCRPR